MDKDMNNLKSQKKKLKNPITWKKMQIIEKIEM